MIFRCLFDLANKYWHDLWSEHNLFARCSYCTSKQNIDVCKTLMPPFPNIWKIGLTFDSDLWPTNLSINRDHLLIKDYLPTKFEAFGAKRSWVISCTRWSRLAWPLTLTFDLNINRGHLLIKDYLPTKFEACGAKPFWVISCTRLRDTDIQTDQHVQSNMPLLFQRGGIKSNSLLAACHFKHWEVGPLCQWPSCN